MICRLVHVSQILVVVVDDWNMASLFAHSSLGSIY